MFSKAKYLIAAAVLLTPCAAYAGSDSDSFTVSATVIASCDVDANDLAFGNYDPVSATPLDSSSTINVVCTNGTSYEVAINAGSGSGASVTTRKMTNSSNLLSYSLYRNAGRTNVWGETSGSNTVTGTGSGAQQSLTVYGRIPVNQTAPAAAYSDTVTVTVTY